MHWQWCICRIVDGSSDKFVFVYGWLQKSPWPILPCSHRNYGRVKSISFFKGYPAVNPQGNFICYRCHHCAISNFCCYVWSSCHSGSALDWQVEFILSVRCLSFLTSGMLSEIQLLALVRGVPLVEMIHWYSSIWNSSHTSFLFLSTSCFSRVILQLNSTFGQEFVVLHTTLSMFGMFLVHAHG